MRSVVADIPKPMAPIAGRPFLAWLLDTLIAHGVDEAVLSVHYKYEVIQGYFGDKYRNIRISYAIEEEPLGTGGAIVNSIDILCPKRPVLVLNGDSMVMVNHRLMYERHCAHDKPLTIALRHVPDCRRYGKVTTDNGEITSFNHAGESGAGYINSGVYVISPDLFDRYDLPQQFSFEKDFCFPYIGEIRPPYIEASEYFIDIGVPEDYARAQKELPELLLETA